MIGGVGVAFIPEYLVNEALKKTPKSFRLYDRDKKNFLTVEGEQTYFVPGSSAMSILSTILLLLKV